ncbi:uncharacterized protein LOC123533397 [Mercenaria mercenaria]|uniref:uncharacterized protein LOC123533397 n=1 Tax=Mercenaria mercenaria TaxID=6596 RepID=UPI00234E8B60|nr:uncharacterized protein LOC123533397 [Mercenaria mercenaria]
MTYIGVDVTLNVQQEQTQLNVVLDTRTARSNTKVKPNGSTVISLATFGDTSQNQRHLDTTTIYLLTDVGAKIPLQVMIVPTTAVILRYIPNSVLSSPYLRNLKLAHPVIDEDQFDISLLIGADHYWSIVGNQTIRGNGPTAVSSSIGYLLSCPVETTRVMTQSCFALNVNTDIDRFWKLESVGIIHEDDQGKDKLQTYQENAIKFTNGKYEAKLPWKVDHAHLPTNYEVTKRRTESLIRRLRREPKILEKYAEILQEQERRDFIEKVDDNEKLPPEVHYIPHHAVIKDSTTTPIRIVYDCSCRESIYSPSLNDCLDSTPPSLNDLSYILVRFLLGKYAVSTDIEKAFLNVRLEKEDRDVTRFLWLSDPSNPDSTLSAYRFKAVLFGATCSPFILSATLLKHLDNNANSWYPSLRRDSLPLQTTTIDSSDGKIPCGTLKKITLPKLELMAAVIGARLARHILQAIDIQDVIFWSDSQIVLHWLSTSRPVNRFVQNRDTDIRDLAQNRKWKYCPTKHYPADLLTRGITASQFRNNHLWMHGPDWLTNQTQWPVWMQADTITMATLTDETQGTDEHPFPGSLLQDGLHVLLNLSRYNSYRKLIRVTAYVFRFINNCRAVTIRRRDPFKRNRTIERRAQVATELQAH